MENPELWIQLGVAGLVLLAFITDRIGPTTRLDKMEQRAERAEAALQQARDDYVKEVVPAVARAVEVFRARETLDERQIQLLTQAEDVLKDVRRLLERDR